MLYEVYTYNMYDILKIAGLFTKKNQIIPKKSCRIALKFFIFVHIIYRWLVRLGEYHQKIPAAAGNGLFYGTEYRGIDHS